MPRPDLTNEQLKKILSNRNFNNNAPEDEGERLAHEGIKPKSKKSEDDKIVAQILKDSKDAKTIFYKKFNDKIKIYDEKVKKLADLRAKKALEKQKTGKSKKELISEISETIKNIESVKIPKIKKNKAINQMLEVAVMIVKTLKNVEY